MTYLTRLINRLQPDTTTTNAIVAKATSATATTSAALELFFSIAKSPFVVAFSHNAYLLLFFTLSGVMSWLFHADTVHESGLVLLFLLSEV